MPKFNVRIHKLGGAPSLPQDVAVDWITPMRTFNGGNAIESNGGVGLIYNESAVAVMLVTPTASTTTTVPATTAIAKPAASDAK